MTRRKNQAKNRDIGHIRPRKQKNPAITKTVNGIYLKAFGLKSPPETLTGGSRRRSTYKTLSLRNYPPRKPGNANQIGKPNKEKQYKAKYPHCPSEAAKKKERKTLVG